MIDEKAYYLCSECNAEVIGVIFYNSKHDPVCPECFKKIEVKPETEKIEEKKIEIVKTEPVIKEEKSETKKNVKKAK